MNPCGKKRMTDYQQLQVEERKYEWEREWNNHFQPILQLLSSQSSVTEGSTNYLTNIVAIDTQPSIQLRNLYRDCVEFVYSNHPLTSDQKQQQQHQTDAERLTQLCSICFQLKSVFEFQLIKPVHEGAVIRPEDVGSCCASCLSSKDEKAEGKQQQHHHQSCRMCHILDSGGISSYDSRVEFDIDRLFVPILDRSSGRYLYADVKNCWQYQFCERDSATLRLLYESIVQLQNKMRRVEDQIYELATNASSSPLRFQCQRWLVETHQRQFRRRLQHIWPQVLLYHDGNPERFSQLQDLMIQFHLLSQPVNPVLLFDAVSFIKHNHPKPSKTKRKRTSNGNTRRFWVRFFFHFFFFLTTLSFFSGLSKSQKMKKKKHNRILFFLFNARRLVSSQHDETNDTIEKENGEEDDHWVSQIPIES
jgi:hypothetical protein